MKTGVAWRVLRATLAPEEYAKLRHEMRRRSRLRRRGIAAARCRRYYREHAAEIVAGRKAARIARRASLPPADARRRDSLARVWSNPGVARRWRDSLEEGRKAPLGYPKSSPARRAEIAAWWDRYWDAAPHQSDAAEALAKHRGTAVAVGCGAEG